jgi:hypothetical protein
VRENPITYWVDDCQVELGVVFDSWKYPDYRHIGGVRVKCHSRHSVTTTAAPGCNGATYPRRAVQRGRVRAGLTGIVYTPAYCVYGYRAYSWMVGATVRTERAGWTNYSPPAIDTVGSC